MRFKVGDRVMLIQNPPPDMVKWCPDLRAGYVSEVVQPSYGELPWGEITKCLHNDEVITHIKIPPIEGEAAFIGVPTRALVKLDDPPPPEETEMHEQDEVSA